MPWTCIADRRGVGRHLVLRTDDFERARKNLSSFTDDILVKDIVKDTLWTTLSFMKELWKQGSGQSHKSHY